MQQSANGSTAASGSRLSGLEADATKMMKELDGLVGKLKDLGQSDPGQLKDAATEALTDQFKALQKKLTDLTAEHQETIAKLDKNVKAHPYLFIFGALGLGILLGKAMRS